jgi:hypothetical protein
MLGWGGNLSRQAESGHEEKHAEASQAFRGPPDAALRLVHSSVLLFARNTSYQQILPND